MSIHSIPKTPGSPFTVSAEQWNQLLQIPQRREATGKPILDQGSQLWVMAENQYKTAGGEEVDLMPGEGVRVQGPYGNNTGDTRDIVFPPDPEKPELVYAFRNEPVLRIYRQVSSGTVGITMDSIPYGHVGRVLIVGTHWCEVTGPRLPPNGWASVASTGRGPLTVGTTGEFKLLAQWRPEADDLETPRTALVQVGPYGFVPQFNAIIRISIWGPPTDGTWGLTWDFPSVTIDDVVQTAFTITLSDLAFDISPADLLSEIITASDGKIASDDFTITGGMLSGFRIEAEGLGNYSRMFLKLPTVDIADLESVVLGAYCSFDQVGFLASGY